MKLTVSALALSLGASGVLASNFVASCKESTIKVSGRTLTASCKNIFGNYNCSHLNLNTCLKNRYGSLQADPDGTGPHLDQCINCTNEEPDTGVIVDGGPSLLYCQCDPGTGAAQANWPTAIFDLNTIVDNQNGILHCYDVKGTVC
ncbi:hypothetical protein B0J18DRAFT_455891 [Chaetomium sp. MPI-SDFR-AT-0129]|nr:hypothetical protein B0J18DRAFT_455891 [Chaetomium sp. MPI-SDFR-AT-0129]